MTAVELIAGVLDRQLKAEMREWGEMNTEAIVRRVLEAAFMLQDTHELVVRDITREIRG